MFHESGGNSIKTEIVSTSPFIIQATVNGERGEFQAIGDADETNVNRLIAKHKYRMAETRAIARALRWYNNIGMCSLEELGGDSDDVSKSPNWDGEPEKQIENNSDLGKCKKCNAEMVRNPKTGKIFCKEKCWIVK